MVKMTTEKLKEAAILWVDVESVVANNRLRLKMTMDGFLELLDLQTCARKVIFSEGVKFWRGDGNKK
jgi:hypothetical protein